MQAAYAGGMGSISLRRQRRQEKLREIVDAFEGKSTGLATASGTPKSHISAMLAGRRGVGDDLAAKFERLAGKPLGWMDEPPGVIAATEDEVVLLHTLRAQRAAKAGAQPSIESGSGEGKPDQISIPRPARRR